MPEPRDESKPLPPPSKKLPASDVLLKTEQAKRWMKRYRTEVAASSSSLLSTFVAYPLDSVKTRMQAYKFASFADCVQITYKTEGFKGFWRGVWSPLASITLVRTASFSIYQKAKYTYDDWIHRATGHSPLVIANTRDALPNLFTVGCFGAAGATSGALITAIACPFELTKLSAQISVLMAKRNPNSGSDEVIRQSYQEKGTFRTAQNIVKHRGFMGLYSGFHFHLLRDTFGTAIYFMTYESSKQLLANARGNSPTSPFAVVIAGGLCGIVSWAAIYPIDSAKSIYQRNCLTSHRDRTHTPKIQFFNPRMYRGLGVSMSRSCVINAIFFSAFEIMKKWVNRLEVDEELLRANRPNT
ncbi:mitochondrial carrier domain-containing protein [Lineolata rhizophorae]|uniref:Mitochondrial carrier domain-containing protein n=1 Tax=Lineolata rhizophorae TaxID=578093 RepID=A0A6A6PC99_9PEZI|nr:mitochondrial carrier domain-containing protein [Lineolata rhizophorae]